MSVIENHVRQAKKDTSRDAIRARIFASRKPASKIITFFGEEIEFRQSTFGEILAAKESASPESAVIGALVSQAFIPGTNEHVFEEGDAEALKAQPFGDDFIRVAKTIEELTQVNFLPQKDS